MGEVLTHLAAWRAAGVIDAATAERISAWDAKQAGVAPGSGRPGISGTFGPSVAIGEFFAYLGVIFVLAAIDAFLARTASSGARQDLVFGIGSAIQAAALAAVGYALLKGDARRRRAAGVAFLVATIHGGAALTFFGQAAGIEGRTAATLGALGAVVLSAFTRRLHPALTTQVALLGALTALSVTGHNLIEQLIFGAPLYEGLEATRGSSEQLLMTAGSAAWWLLTGLGLGLIGLYESRHEGVVEGASQRAGVSRLWAGIVAISGFCGAVTRSDMLPGGEYGRVLESWVAEIAILLIAAVLLERAFRRNSTAFVIAGAIGLIVALTDFNFSYLADQTEVGLLIEGLILLGVGFGADRLRRRLARQGGPDQGAAAGTPVSTAPDQPGEAVAPVE